MSRSLDMVEVNKTIHTTGHSTIHPSRQMSALDSHLGEIINVLLWKVQQFVQSTFVVFEVTTAIWVEDAGVHHLAKPDAFAFLDLFHTSGVSLL